MAPTLTTRLQLSKPDGDDFVNVLTDLDANYDKIDLLDKKPSPITQPFIKRNQTDNVTSGTDSIKETLTVNLKANHWYEATWSGQYDTSLGINTVPDPRIGIRLKAGATVAITDPMICLGNSPNIDNCSPRFVVNTVFDVPTDGAYTLGMSVNSGGAGNTVHVLASGGTDNTGTNRCMWVKDLGEK